jgi:hypothetical protein
VKENRKRKERSMAPVYGVFEDRNLISGHFSDLGSAEDHKDQMASDEQLIYGDLEALELCPDHETHPYGECEAYFVQNAADEEEIIELLHRVKEGLERA